MRAQADASVRVRSLLSCALSGAGPSASTHLDPSRILDTVHLGLVMHTVYWYTVSQYGDFHALDSLVWCALSLYALGQVWLIVQQESDRSDRRWSTCTFSESSLAACSHGAFSICLQPWYRGRYL
jgi:hypothetical protein